MNIKKQIRQPTNVVLDTLNNRSKKEWIESAVVLKRERFEIAGALLIVKMMPCCLSRKLFKRCRPIWD